MKSRKPRKGAKRAAGGGDSVARYKGILQKIIETRPSGTRQRLASTLGKNRSFISQITSPSYATPIPPRHLETIFEICHFSPEERQRFLDAYGEAHRRRLPTAGKTQRLRPHTVHLPDLGDDARNRDLDRTVGDFVQKLTRLIGGG